MTIFDWYTSFKWLFGISIATFFFAVFKDLISYSKVQTIMITMIKKFKISGSDILISIMNKGTKVTNLVLLQLLTQIDHQWKVYF